MCRKLSFSFWILLCLFPLALSGCGSLGRQSTEDLQRQIPETETQKQLVQKNEGSGQKVARDSSSDGIRGRLSERFKKVLGRDLMAKTDRRKEDLERQVSGVWMLDEGEGKHVCRVTLLSGHRKQFLRGSNCEGSVENVFYWALFGSELQLLDRRNVVVGRLRFERDTTAWKGSAVRGGSPLSMVRP